MSKCCYIHFKPNSHKPRDPGPDASTGVNLNLVINDFVLKKVQDTKFLGVIIDENLSWDAHLKDVKRKLNYATATLNRIKSYVPVHMHKDLYYTLFESHLSYCISVWGATPQNKISAIFTTQKQCIRIIFGDREAFLDKFRT